MDDFFLRQMKMSKKKSAVFLNNLNRQKIWIAWEKTLVTTFYMLVPKKNFGIFFLYRNYDADNIAQIQPFNLVVGVL